MITPASHRVVVDGKFFRVGDTRFCIKGLTYGPFAANARGEMFPEPEQVERDFQQIRELGANLLRLYYVPPRWFLDAAQRHGLKLLVDIPWPKHLCFLDDEDARNDAREAVREAVTACKDHPAVFAYSVVNEIPADIVRWSGVRRVERFIDELVEIARSVDPECLCTFTTFPPTEYLNPQNIDFVCFNVYLHDRGTFESYLARLQMLADTRPLVLGEFGIDSYREGEEKKCEILAWQIEAAFQGGLAGMIVFSYTDDWWRGGYQIEDWAFGLTTRDRQPKPSFHIVRKQFQIAPHFPLPKYPKVSVVVASYNGARTLKACLDSLARLNYPDYEVILVDDGSTDNTQGIAAQYPAVRNIRQTNQGLSAARNVGIHTATGELVAFTDSDCRADEDWLFYLVGDLLSGEFVGIGGHNFLPPEDSCVAAAVLVSPGGPAHVMLNDRVAEHVPGCNMAFYKWALDEIGGFDHQFRKAGDDVDVCWRLQESGYPIGFSPAGFVWHYRRSTVRAYLKQQSGYGEAEALLMRKHPEYFSAYGGGIWRGRIYTTSKYGITLRRSIIYHGIFASGFFQKLYTPEPSHALMLFTSLEYHALVNLALVGLSSFYPLLWPLAITSLALSVGICAVAGAQADLPRRKTRFWSRPLVALLYFLQPIVRGWSRYKWRFNIGARPHTATERLSALEKTDTWESLDSLSYWSDSGPDRFALLGALAGRLERQLWQIKIDNGWNNHDLEIFGNRWTRLRVTSVIEELGAGKTNYRWRLAPDWSLRARAAFFVMAGAQLAAIHFLAESFPWIWLILLSLPLFAWFLAQEKRNLQLLVADMLDELARQYRMVKLSPEKRAGETKAAATPDLAGSA